MFDRTSPWFIHLTAFVAGCAVMAIEITSSRLLAPFFGTSLFVWTNIIGAVLIALSLGYYLGGRLSDWRPDINLLLKILLTTGLIIFSIPFLVRIIGEQWVLPELFGQGMSQSVLGFVAIMLILGIPLLLLGMVPPYLMKVYSVRNPRFGGVAGSVSAVSTIGSIVGTYLPTLWLIPTFGARLTVIIFALSLVSLGFFGIIGGRKRLMILILLAVLLPLAWQTSAVAPMYPGVMKILWEEDSAYQYLRVAEDAAGTRYLLYNQGLGFQSVYDPSKILTGYYYDFYNILPSLVVADRRAQVLLLGLAGGTIARQLDHFYGNSVQLSAVEIDPSVIELSQEFFSAREIPMRVYNADARVFLSRTPQLFDIIIVDAFRNEYEIAWTLTTREFWQLLERHLAPGGVVAVNVTGSQSGSRLLNLIANTQASVFASTYRADLTGQAAGNALLVAGSQPLKFSSLSDSLESELASLAAALANDLRKVDYQEQLGILTDDRAPVELLTGTMLLTGGKN